MRPSSGRMAVAAQAGVPSAFHFTVAPPGQQRSMKSGRGRPACTNRPLSASAPGRHSVASIHSDTQLAIASARNPAWQQNFVRCTVMMALGAVLQSIQRIVKHHLTSGKMGSVNPAGGAGGFPSAARAVFRVRHTP